LDTTPQHRPEWPVHAIGVVRSPRDEAVDDDWGEVDSIIELVEPYGPTSIAGIEEFTHIEVIFLFDRVDPASVTTGARRPRGNPAWPEVGIFAQRGKNRPNRLGLVTCNLVRVEGTRLHVNGLDAIDGSPVLDIKPHMAEFAPRGRVSQPAWSHDLMRDYW
jgi:tRNA-Thr(GGU) m(6)t(6)A37 methyltransferase TsaA